VRFCDYKSGKENETIDNNAKGGPGVRLYIK
jgi:hypothetical protein